MNTNVTMHLMLMMQKVFYSPKFHFYLPNSFVAGIQTKGSSVKPFRYWTADSMKNTRLFLEQFALSKNLDPLLASSWYTAASDFMQSKVF